MRKICVLGSTGSIGQSTLDVIRNHFDQYKIVALTAHRNVSLLAQQCIEFQPEVAVVGDQSGAVLLAELIGEQCPHLEIEYGESALMQAAAHSQVDTVMAAIVGSAGLKPTMAAVESGKRILLANKEALVMAGDLFMKAVAKHRVELLPIDSEHNAIYQCLPDAHSRNAEYRGSYHNHGVLEILLTASGGPFRTLPLDHFYAITPEQACAHPNWSMGKKISVDSATMMNKGLEVIEAHHLFGVDASRIQVLIHPQSTIHSMVRYIDGSVIAQLGEPDMKTPIAYGLAWPMRINAGVASLDFQQLTQLNFESVDSIRYPCLELAYAAMNHGGGMPAVLNAANEIAVDAFLSKRIRFTAIHDVVYEVLSKSVVAFPQSLSDIFEIDQEARLMANKLVGTVLQ